MNPNIVLFDLQCLVIVWMKTVLLTEFSIDVSAVLSMFDCTPLFFRLIFDVFHHFIISSFHFCIRTNWRRFLICLKIFNLFMKFFIFIILSSWNFWSHLMFQINFLLCSRSFDSFLNVSQMLQNQCFWNFSKLFDKSLFYHIDLIRPYPGF
jgi:hypothetical protein